MSWKVDESGNAVANGAEVKFEGAGGSEKKGNAIWMDENAGQGVHCWSFDISGDSGLWIGVGTEEKFGSGYKLKGLLYGGPGNLSDGGALVQSQWGPKFGQGDKIVMRLEVSGDNTTVAFSKNGIGLGVAYDITGWDGSNLKPVVSLGSPGQGVSINSVSDPGLQSMGSAGGPPPGLAGSWQLDGGEVSLSIEEEGSNKWRVSAQVANNLGTLVTQENGSFSSTPCMSTRMMPPPELQQLENSIGQLLSNITNMSRDGDKLLLTSGDRKETFSVGPGSVPATKENVNWMNK